MVTFHFFSSSRLKGCAKLNLHLINKSSNLLGLMGFFCHSVTQCDQRSATWKQHGTKYSYVQTHYIGMIYNHRFVH